MPDIPYKNVAYFLALVAIVVAIVLLTRGGADDTNGDIPLEPTGPFIKLEGIVTSDQCPSDDQKQIDGFYLPMKAVSGVGDIEKNDFPVYVNQNGYILLKTNTGDNFHIYKNEADAATDNKIAYISQDMKIHTKMGCPVDHVSGSVTTKNGATLKNT